MSDLLSEASNAVDQLVALSDRAGQVVTDATAAKQRLEDARLALEGQAHALASRIDGVAAKTQKAYESLQNHGDDVHRKIAQLAEELKTLDITARKEMATMLTSLQALDSQQQALNARLDEVRGKAATAMSADVVSREQLLNNFSVKVSELEALLRTDLGSASSHELVRVKEAVGRVVSTLEEVRPEIAAGLPDLKKALDDTVAELGSAITDAVSRNKTKAQALMTNAAKITHEITDGPADSVRSLIAAVEKAIADVKSLEKTVVDLLNRLGKAQKDGGGALNVILGIVKDLISLLAHIRHMAEHPPK